MFIVKSIGHPDYLTPNNSCQKQRLSLNLQKPTILVLSKLFSGFQYKIPYLLILIADSQTTLCSYIAVSVSWKLVSYKPYIITEG